MVAKISEAAIPLSPSQGGNTVCKKEWTEKEKAKRAWGSFIVRAFLYLMLCESIQQAKKPKHGL